MTDPKTPPESAHITNFIRQRIDETSPRASTRSGIGAASPGPRRRTPRRPSIPAKIRTRFPPEPNGYLHIGHAKSICLNFGLAQEYGGVCHMRFDDTNPEKEEQEYVDAILDSVHWLGFHWGKNDENLYHASDYFDWMYEFAVELIKHGDAYVDSQTADEMRATRGSLTEHGIESPYRKRSVEENLKLFDEMRDGKYPDGAHVLRAKIDMKSPNINMRDPAIYRIRNADAPPHRRQVAHLPDVHLRAPDRGRAGEHHALALHAGVRGPAALLRLGAGEDRFLRSAAAAIAAADRILAPEPHLHRDEQAVPHPAREGGARGRMGRPDSRSRPEAAGSSTVGSSLPHRPRPRPDRALPGSARQGCVEPISPRPGVAPTRSHPTIGSTASQPRPAWRSGFAALRFQQQRSADAGATTHSAAPWMLRGSTVPNPAPLRPCAPHHERCNPARSGPGLLQPNPSDTACCRLIVGGWC